ncbi:tetratricopeptide repeat protein [Microbacterium sp. Bi128]|uniref:tetratricopeptide repeat protein n=1 Tax=Microbacterium sp. Bi128 TaxID=2821115 RepID=UPI001D46DEBD|nr:tetratricopeptide repeat protein [Microbacterium sp. Bi128]CAH0247602.1 Beta-barrel assembly-enhancing protease [Microbacterium sp. Bi128]
MKTATFVDFYEILSLPETADADRIREAIRGQRRIWNKRAGQSDVVQKSVAEQRIRDLADAERVLLDASARRTYDSTRVQDKARAGAESAAATRSTSEGARDWLAEARTFYATGNAHAANYAAREAIAVNGASHEAWNIRANSSFILANYADAGFEFREAIRLMPHNAAYHFDYGEAHAAAGNWADALAEYEIALQQVPGDPVYKTAIANVYLNTGKSEQALPLMEEVVKAQPGAEVFQYYLAWALHDVNLAKWSRLRGGGFLITSPEQIRITREMSGRALRLTFSDDALRASLQDNLRRADLAEASKWTGSGNILWYLGAALAGLIMLFAGFGAGSAVVGLLGLLIGGLAVWLFIARHHKPGWKFNAANPAVHVRGV